VETSGDEVARFFGVVLPHLNELQRRVVAGAMAEALGRGGKTAVAETSGMSRNTVIKAEREVGDGIDPSDRLRALGGGDIKSEDKQPGLIEALDELVHPETRGNPMSYMRWTSKSTGNCEPRPGVPRLITDHHIEALIIATLEQTPTDLPIGRPGLRPRPREGRVERIKYLVHDRDNRYCAVFYGVFTA
jgi:hypothetical protein